MILSAAFLFDCRLGRSPTFLFRFQSKRSGGPPQPTHLSRPLLALLAASVLSGTILAAEPVAVRVESFLVTPASQPAVFVVIENRQDAPYLGTVTLGVPQGWKMSPPHHDVSIAPGATARVSFDVQKGVSVESNRYHLEVNVAGPTGTVTHKQEVVCTSAPYFKPTVDGNTDDWADAIPATFVSDGRKTAISTFWNSRRFSLLVAVEEDDFLRCPTGRLPERFDSVQLAISPKGTTTGKSPSDESSRFEFLFVGSTDGTGRCFRLSGPGMPLSVAAENRPLEPLEYEDAQVAVSRRGSTTYYEISLPFSPMRDLIRPSEGREFCLSLLVHDPDGTGLRDWGAAAGLRPWERNRLAWSRWVGAHWPEEPPFDNKLPWGLCSSKY